MDLMSADDSLVQYGFTTRRKAAKEFGAGNECQDLGAGPLGQVSGARKSAVSGWGSVARRPFTRGTSGMHLHARHQTKMNGFRAANASVIYGDSRSRIPCRSHGCRY